MNKKKVYPGTPQFYNLKVGCKGVYFTRTCYPDALSNFSQLAQFWADFAIKATGVSLTTRNVIGAVATVLASV